MKNKILKGTVAFLALTVLILGTMNVSTYQKLINIESEYGTQLNFEIHVSMWHYRNGELLEYSHHAGVLTTIGQDYIEGKLGGVNDADFSNNATYIGLSNNTGAPNSGWTVIPDEITTGGMSRTTGTYVNDGVGQWNITKSFSPTESNSTRLTGLYWDTGSDLIASDTFTAINYQNGDTVTITWTISVA